MQNPGCPAKKKKKSQPFGKKQCFDDKKTTQ